MMDKSYWLIFPAIIVALEFVNLLFRLDIQKRLAQEAVVSVIESSDGATREFVVFTMGLGCKVYIVFILATIGSLVFPFHPTGKHFLLLTVYLFFLFLYFASYYSFCAISKNGENIIFKTLTARVYDKKISSLKFEMLATTGYDISGLVDILEGRKRYIVSCYSGKFKKYVRKL